MKNSLQRLFAILLLLVAWNAPHAAPRLDVGDIKKLYKDGEFEKVRDILEDFLKRNDKTANREQKILAYKYLGVVYATKPEGKPQAEAYFFRLFDLAANVQLIELYVSSSVEDLFQKTNARHKNETQSATKFDEYGNPITHKGETVDSGDAMLAAVNTESKKSSGPLLTEKPIWKAEPKKTKVESSHSGSAKVWPWIIGAAVVGGGVGLYLYTSKSTATDAKPVIQVPPL